MLCRTVSKAVVCYAKHYWGQPVLEKIGITQFEQQLQVLAKKERCCVDISNPKHCDCAICILNSFAVLDTEQKEDILFLSSAGN